MSHTLALNSDYTPLGLLPLSTMNWQDTMKAVYRGTVRVLHEYENWIVHSPRFTCNVPSVVVAKEFVKYRRTVAYTDEYVKLRDDYRCQYCGDVFPADKLTMDHVIPKSQGGKGGRFDNFVAACGPCNWSRGNNTRIQPRKAPYRPAYMELVSKRRKYGIDIPSADWLAYIGWDESLVRIVPPAQEPGFLPDAQPLRAFKTILLPEV